ncbi:MAG: hypothetical protein QNJ68_11585 [Microcoleaceae cyanobacterium MO_207.B10]|nr:hypothetical protein [Microcoleaceae cyanobacterium MO_207.B10]
MSGLDICLLTVYRMSSGQKGEVIQSELFQQERQTDMRVNDLNNTSCTDWDGLEKMTDEEIDCSDIPRYQIRLNTYYIVERYGEMGR